MEVVQTGLAVARLTMSWQSSAVVPTSCLLIILTSLHSTPFGPPMPCSSLAIALLAVIGKCNYLNTLLILKFPP